MSQSEHKVLVATTWTPNVNWHSYRNQKSIALSRSLLLILSSLIFYYQPIFIIRMDREICTKPSGSWRKKNEIKNDTHFRFRSKKRQQFRMDWLVYCDNKELTLTKVEKIYEDKVLRYTLKVVSICWSNIQFGTKLYLKTKQNKKEYFSSHFNLCMRVFFCLIAIPLD